MKKKNKIKRTLFKMCFAVLVGSWFARQLWFEDMAKTWTRNYCI